jgi:hypothetical protein
MELTQILPFWQSLIRGPEPALAKEKGKGGLVDALVMVLIVAVISAIFAVLGLMVSTAVNPTAALGVVGIPMFFVGSLVMGAVFFFILSAVFYVISMVLGGKGSFSDQTYLFSLVYTLSIISSVIGIIPILGAIASLVIGLFMLYLYALALKVVHGFSLMKALAIIIIPIIIVGILFVILVVVGLALNIPATTLN